MLMAPHIRICVSKLLTAVIVKWEVWREDHICIGFLRK